MILPPGLFCLLILFCLVFRHRKFGTGLLAITGALVYLSSIPATQNWLGGLMQIDPWTPAAKSESQAIVVLGGGRYAKTLDYGGDTVNHLTLERLRYAAIVQQKTGLPILLSGGKAIQGARSEAELMRDILTQEFRGRVHLMETRSRTTFENAQFSARILTAKGIRKIILVTHAYHMPRAMEAFERAGLTVTPAATIFLDRSDGSLSFGQWIPSLNAFYWVNLMAHELVGRLWYHIRYYQTIQERVKLFS